MQLKQNQTKIPFCFNLLYYEGLYLNTTLCVISGIHGGRVCSHGSCREEGAVRGHLRSPVSTAGGCDCVA